MDAGTEGDVRMSGKTELDADGAVAGVLEVFHAGAWGTVCQDYSSSLSLFDYSGPAITEVCACTLSHRFNNKSNTECLVQMPQMIAQEHDSLLHIPAQHHGSDVDTKLLHSVG